MRWQSKGSRLCARQALTMAGPMVRFGTKWPSMTSRWRRSAPASMEAISSASLLKSADSSDGAIFMIVGCRLSVVADNWQPITDNSLRGRRRHRGTLDDTSLLLADHDRDRVARADRRAAKRELPDDDA